MLACAPLLMVVVSLFERRWGPTMAGIVAAAPLTALIGLLLVHSDLGASASHEMALRMGGFVPAQVGIAFVVVALVARIGFPAALVVGLLAYGVLAAASARLPVELAIAVSIALLVVGQRLVRTPDQTNEGDPETPTGAWIIGVRALVSLATAVGLLVVANQFGPAAGGAVGAFPIFTVALCCFIYAAFGAHGVTQVLSGMVRGLPPYFAFVLTYGVTGPHAGAVGAVGAGTLVCTCFYLSSAWRSTARARSTAEAPCGGEAQRAGAAGNVGARAT